MPLGRLCEKKLGRMRGVSKTPSRKRLDIFIVGPNSTVTEYMAMLFSLCPFDKCDV
jgi:hypothetical protein